MAIHTTKPVSLGLFFTLLASIVVASLLWLTPSGSNPPLRHQQMRDETSSSSETKSVVLPRVVLFGDSLTERSFSESGAWGAILAHRLVRKADVVNRGFGGYTTRMAKAVLPAIVNSFGAPIAAVAVLLGTNDALQTNRLRVPLEEYKNNLKWIVQYLVKERGVGSEKIVLISLPVFDPVKWFHLRAESPVVDNYTAPYAQACGEVAAELGCGFLDWNRLMQTEHKEQWKTFLHDDGLHFSAKGSRVLADALWPLIEKRTAHLPYVMPYYTTMLNYDDPAVDIAQWLTSYKAPRS